MEKRPAQIIVGILVGGLLILYFIQHTLR